MTNLIVTDAQDLEISSPLVELYELTIGADPTQADTNKLYFHAAKDLDGSGTTDIIFDGNTYVTLPIMMDDIEKKTGGTMNRPKLTIANVESLIKTGSSFRTQIDDDTWNAEIDGEAVTDINFKLDHLVGQRLERRRTLEKYTGSDVVAYEFDREVFIIDRIAAISPLFCELELASPADIGGVRIPNRQVIGKYCPWVYQGGSLSTGLTKSACRWKLKDHITKNEGTTKYEYSFYFTTDDEPLVLASYLTGTSYNAAWKGVWASGTAYATGEYVSHQSEYDVVVAASTSSSINFNLTVGTYNSKLRAGFEMDYGSAPKPKIVQVAGTRVTVDRAISVNAGTFTFTSPNMYYRTTRASTGIEPAEGVLQWGQVRRYTAWNNSTTYAPHASDSRQSDYVKHGDTIWRAIQTNEGIAPGSNANVWTRGDVCGKLLTSCKIRYQAIPQLAGAAYDDDAIPDYDTDTMKTLPFGGFPGSKKFR
tara:strand:+ start:483 stop:1916 length:1434 start_codon:yes stop_codon:yes gene_type:complete